MPHRRYTIAKLRITPAHLTAMLERELSMGRRIHIPCPIHNPVENRTHYHWRFRGHDRQVDNNLLSIILDFAKRDGVIRVAKVLGPAYAGCS